ncbi:MAG: hypothetical protein B7Z75_12180 [Acidocella sp. 20-57-95]|nr:MAG: hypothetical protein B7Z75_12180 [Acidocella sp. 20-57-95]OYV62170.1 MAG: hypothetical protein B7Z71_02275 [Acidocella sp. 21-58-7]
MGNIFSLLGLAALVGGMLFFGAVMAPLVFTQLAPDVAGKFIRTAFPFYYAFVAASAVLAAIGFGLRGDLLAVGLLLAIAVAVLWAWLWLVPHLNALRDAGDMVGFARGHTLSVWLNGAELLVGLGLLVRSALNIGLR